jgi:hypothetical protein
MLSSIYVRLRNYMALLEQDYVEGLLYLSHIFVLTTFPSADVVHHFSGAAHSICTIC